MFHKLYTMKKDFYIILICLLLFASGCSNQKKVTVVSPDGSISFEIMASGKSQDRSVANFSLTAGSKQVLLPSSLDLKMKNIISGNKFRIVGTSSETINTSWINNFGERKVVPDNYNQTMIFLESEDLKINLICRAYNEGVAFAYEFPKQEGIDSVVITDEKITFRFPG